MDETMVVRIVGGGFAALAALLCVQRAKLSRSHRRFGQSGSWLGAAGVLGLVAASVIAVPGAWIDGYGGVLRVLSGG